MKRTIASVLAAASLAVAGNVAAEDDMATAREYLDSGLYVEALYYLRAAADSGDAQAAGMLGCLRHFGGEASLVATRDSASAAQTLARAALQCLQQAADADQPAPR